MTTAPSNPLSDSPTRAGLPMDVSPTELVGGFVREAQKLLSAQARIPPLIEYLCLVYFVIDCFDTGSIGSSMKLQQNGHKVTMMKDRPESAFLRHVVDARCRHYTWRFRFNRLRFAHFWTTTIGIWKCRKATSSSPKTDGIFTIDGAYPKDPAGASHIAYGIAANKGTLVDPESGSGGDGGASFGKMCGTGDIVDMMLDFEKLELHFSVNGTAYGCAFAVEDTEYRAAVNLSQKGDSIQIMK